jgi:hypothetical protein
MEKGIVAGGGSRKQTWPLSIEGDVNRARAAGQANCFPRRQHLYSFSSLLL